MTHGTLRRHEREQQQLRELMGEGSERQQESRPRPSRKGRASRAQESISGDQLFLVLPAYEENRYVLGGRAPEDGGEGTLARLQGSRSS